MCMSSLLMLSSQILIIFLNAHCLSSSSDWAVVFSFDAIIATSETVQRQVFEKPTSLPLLAAGGILASTMLSGGP